MKVLLTGAHGFIGSHTCMHLIERGYHVRALVSPWGHLGNLAPVIEHERLEIVRADISKLMPEKNVCEDIDCVIHAAARVADWGPWDWFFKTNVLGTQQVLNNALFHGVKRFILISSVAVHQYTGFINADPATRLRDRFDQAYAYSKILAENIVQAAPIESLIIRPGLWPYGPNDKTFLTVLKTLKRGLLPYVGSGEAVFNTAYIGNFVEGLEAALKVSQATGNIYLLADEGMISWQALFTHLSHLINVKPPSLHLAPQMLVPLSKQIENLWQTRLPKQEPWLTVYRTQLMLNNVHFATNTSQQALNYQARWSWKEGLKNTIQALA